MSEDERQNENDDIQNFDEFTDDGYTDPDAAGGAGDSDYTYADEENNVSDMAPIAPPPPDYERDPDEELPDEIAEEEALPLPEEKTQDELIEEAIPVKKGNPHENKAQFFYRTRAVTAILVVFIVLIIFFTVLLPIIRPAGKKEKTKELEKAGTVYIPSELQEKPEEAPETKEDFSGGNSKTNNDALGEKFPPPLEAPPVKQPIAAGGTQGSSVSVPITNQNEQQKAFAYVPLDMGKGRTDGTQQQGAQQRNALPQTTSSYMPAALEQNVTNYLSSLQHNGNGNNYVSQNDQSGKQRFMNNNASGGGNYRWNSLYSLWKGTVIPAVLETGINTDLPGVVTATVTQNVYSSQDGRYLLIPQGSKLFATYNSSITYGQNRIQVAWNTLIRPDGLEIDLGNVMGVDKKGFSGYSGWVSEHPFEYAKALGLIAMFSILETKVDNTTANTNNVYTQNALADTYNEARKLNNKIIERALDIQPTLYKFNGSKVNLITNITMDIPPIEPFPAEAHYVRE